MPAPTEGPLVIGDISGYTEFVSKTEIDHSLAIVHELLECMVSSVSGHLEVSQVEGDCVLFIGGVPAAQVVELLESTFVGFRRRRRAMQEMTTCPCAACRNIGILTLKFVVHHGPYSRARVGGVEQLHGSDVILAFRLLKNHVPAREYLLLTDAVLGRLPPDERSRFQPHVEEYEHLGAVRAGYRELGPIWESALAAERRRVEPEEAMLRSVVEVEAPIDAVWQVVIDAGTWKELMKAHHVAVLPGARGTLADGAIHCHHGKDGKQLTEFRVMLAAPPRELSLFSRDQVDFYQTMTLTELDPERTRVETSVMWHARPGIRGRLTSAAFRLLMGRSLAGGARTLRERARAAAPART